VLGSSLGQNMLLDVRYHFRNDIRSPRELFRTSICSLAFESCEKSSWDQYCRLEGILFSLSYAVYNPPSHPTIPCRQTVADHATNFHHHLSLAEPGLVSQNHAAHHVHRSSKASKEDGQIWVQDDLALRCLVPLTNVLSRSLLEQTLVVRDSIFAVDEACHCDGAA